MVFFFWLSQTSNIPADNNHGKKDRRNNWLGIFLWLNLILALYNAMNLPKIDLLLPQHNNETPKSLPTSISFLASTILWSAPLFLLATEAECTKITSHLKDKPCHSFWTFQIPVLILNHRCLAQDYDHNDENGNLAIDATYLIGKCAILLLWSCS